MKKQFISWRRVSTFKQNRSGLGLEAQKEIIRYFVERDNGKLVADYSECYTGKELSGCKELRKAMQHAKNIGAVLVIAKSDRFRNCQEALGILDEMGEGHLEFCDLPHSDRFTLTLFWALAEREALITSIRTKQALAVKKAQGCKFGAASEKYKETYYSKTYLERREFGKKRGATKSCRYKQSRDVVAFLRILKTVFPSACTTEDAAGWDWSQINSKGDNKNRILSLISDYKSIDDSGTLFCKWEIDKWNDTKKQVRLCSTIGNIRKSFLNQKKDDVI